MVYQDITMNLVVEVFVPAMVFAFVLAIVCAVVFAYATKSYNCSCYFKRYGMYYHKSDMKAFICAVKKYRFLFFTLFSVEFFFLSLYVLIHLKLFGGSG